jgi:hypothetical protein
MTRATREVSWNGMLIDWEGVGPERRFELRVPDVLQAGNFYRDVFDGSLALASLNRTCRDHCPDFFRSAHHHGF